MEEKLEFRVNEWWQRFAVENPWATVILEFANNNGTRYARVKDRKPEVHYRIINDEDGQHLECIQCNIRIQYVKIIHPLGDCSFSGKCYTEDDPYCPKCDGEKTAKIGSIVMPKAR
jgi:hypothetical protein